jgi:hypothetical protein
MDTAQDRHRPFQLSLRKLMLWMVVLAAYITLVRWTGLFLPLAALLTAYVALVVFVRLRCGFRRGYKIAALGTAVLVGCLLVCFFLLHHFTGYSRLTSELWPVVLATAGGGCVVGLAVGFLAFSVVHLIVCAVDLVDALMQTRTPKD